MQQAAAKQTNGVLRGDWLYCGSCDSRVGLGVAAIRQGARVQCRHCRLWVLLPIPEARE